VFSHIIDLGSERHALASECAGDQGKFWEMHDLLFEKQGSLGGRNVDATLTGLARDLKLDEAQFSQCMANNTHPAIIKQAHDKAKAANIRIRPTFDLNGRRIQGALAWSQFQAALAEATK
jgi:protein-disulfide isomerase